MHKVTDLESKYILLIVIPMLNLLFMHYYFYTNRLLEWAWKYSEVINLCGVVFDVSVLAIIALLLLGGRLKPALAITQVLTVVWSFINVMYGKFFFEYMSLSTIGEIHGLGDDLVINSILSAFCWYDLFYLASIVGFLVIYKTTKAYTYNLKKTLKILIIPFLSIVITLVAYSLYHFVLPQYRNNWELYKFRTIEFLYDSVRGGTPNLAHFQNGCIRVVVFELFDLLHDTELTVEQRKEIEDNYLNHSLRTTHHQSNPNIKNVIFILLESFLSSPIDLIIDRKEITPFLNSLKRDSNVYYNGNMISDIGCGESGDGQFIYMTGILPLRHKMTVGQVKNNILPSLPKVLKSGLGIKHTEIIFPTMPNLWQQADMNIAYGIDYAYSIEDIVGNNSGDINDEKIFKYAANSLSMSKAPFFSLILSVSAHSPYDKYVGKDLCIKDSALPMEYKNYLNTCHYTDKQLRDYINRLKSTGLYDSSLIVIASDHHAHLDRLKMDGKISPHTPLFIINGKIEQNLAWKKEFHQLDVYTTLLDLLNIKQSWRGLGNTLLSPSYRNSVNPETSRLSDFIIEGNYFAQSR